MLRNKEFVCTTEMMAAFIPDYRRRICDLKKDYELEGRPCRQHEHKSKILKEWRLIGKITDYDFLNDYRKNNNINIDEQAQENGLVEQLSL